MSGKSHHSVAAGLPLRAGIGLRAQHHADIVARKPAVGWMEAHSENYFAAGGAQRNALERIRASYPLSLHGVGLSIGSTDPLSEPHLQQLARLVRDLEPALVSEHLSWSSVGGRFANDLLPLPYTEEALRHMVCRVQQVQHTLGRQILIENVSSYLQYPASRLTEWEFLADLACQSGCGILLDVNNVYVSSQNHGFDARDYLLALPPTAVQEIHLAGHTESTLGTQRVLIDTHDRPVCESVWQLYELAIRHLGPVPTLIEWDAELPDLDVLVCEAHQADQRQARQLTGMCHAAVA